MVYLGIDVGGTGIKVGVIDGSGNLLIQGETPTLAGRSFSEIIRDMGVCALDALERGGYVVSDVAAVGVGVPGVADQETGVVVFCTNLGWHNVPLRTELQKYIDRPVFIGNDATVAGYAESVYGLGAGSHSSVFLTLGTGVGGGIVIGGRPWSGFHGVGSEIGHMPMDIEGEPCTCGNNGCLERYCSATAIIRMGRQAALQHPDSALYTACSGNVDKIDAKTVIDCAKEGDDTAMKVFHRYVNYLCMALDGIIAFFDPEVIILGGGVSKAGNFLLNAVRERLKDYILFKDLPYSRVEIARLGANAGMIGAAMLGKKFVEEA
jgi:glucokinase